MVLVGDGILSLIDPKRHCLLWDVGPKVWRSAVDEFVSHPEITRGVGLAEAVFGVWLATQQKPRLRERFTQRARNLAGV